MPLTEYQFYSVGWLLKQLLNGNLLVILAHDMGLGKTPTAFATWLLLRRFDVEIENPPEVQDRTESEHYFDSIYLSGRSQDIQH